MTWRRVLAILALFAASHGAGVARDAAAQGPRPDGFTTLGHMRRGVNILGYDGVWQGYVDNPFRMSNLKLIRAAGFDHVRINFFGFRVMDSADRLDETVLGRLDKVLDSVIAADLTPVLEQHDNSACQSNPATCEARLLAFWRQVSARYRGTKPRVVYEILNEPGGAMTEAAWNGVQSATLAAIRANDPNRTLIVAALNAGDPRSIERLLLPDGDRNLIVTVHYYAPMEFTHQGAPWNRELAKLKNVTWGTQESRARMVADLALARDWADAHHRPVYLGEFGVYDAAPPASRAAWAANAARTSEQFGWGWAYWQFDHDFALFDSATQSWNRSLLNALVGEPR